MSTAAPTVRGPARSPDQLAARRRAFDLVRWSQTGEGVTPDAIAALIEHGAARGWPDVVRLGIYVKIVYARYVVHADPWDAIEELMRRALDDDDPASLALAYAVRAQDRAIREERAPVDADRDLARATALLENVIGPSSEAVTAHIQCGLACEPHELWELQLRHYAAAETHLDPEEDPEIRRATLRYNRAEVQLNWLVARRELRDEDDLASRAASARAALRAADVPEMPPLWREELEIFADLVDAISPTDPGATSRRSSAGEFRGYVHLARALRETDPARARAECDRAIATIDPAIGTRMRLFALVLAAELESAACGRETAGLRLGRELIAQRAERRTAALASIESLVAIERNAAEHAQLRQHAYLDDLTGLGNRRELIRFAAELRGRGVTTTTIAVIDLDRFKQINDTHGHATGDAVLIRAAQLMRDAVRERDLVVRLGGDEFLVLLTMADTDAAHRRCEAIRAAIEHEPWQRICRGLAPGASVGIAHGSLADLDALITAADAALYRAKQAGRNRVAA